VTDDTQSQDCFISISNAPPKHTSKKQDKQRRRQRAAAQKMVFEAMTWDDFVTLGQQRWEQTGQTIGMVDAREDNHHHSDDDDADDSGIGRCNNRRRRRRRVLAGGAADNGGCDTLLLSWLKPVVVIPLAELPRRRFELPAPGGPDSFGIVVSHWNDLETVQALLGAKSNKTKASSWGDVSSSSCGTIWGVVLPGDEVEEGDDGRPYDDDKVDEGRPRDDDNEKGKSRIPLPPQQQLPQQQQPKVAVPPLPRLWRPDPMVEMVLLPRLKANLADVWRNRLYNHHHNNDHWPTTVCNSTILQVLDVGSGVGRDLCFLSEELRGALGNKKDNDDDLRLHFVGADQRYRENNNNDDETTAFWRRRGQLDRCSCLCVDLKKKNSLDDFVEQHVLHRRGRTATTTTTTTTTVCVYAVRYWNDALFARLAKCLTAPGTIVAVSHFCKPHNDYNWDQLHSSPKVTLVVIR
jgi:hypothetical protein